MAARGRRRQAPVVRPKVVEPEVATQESTPTPEDGEEATDTEPESAIEPQEQEADMGTKYVALSRLKYTKRGGAAVIAEPGEYLEDALPQDIEDHREAGLLESFDEHVVEALKEAMSKNPDAVRKILGL